VTEPILHPISVTVLPAGPTIDQYIKLICTTTLLLSIHTTLNKNTEWKMADTDYQTTNIIHR